MDKEPSARAQGEPKASPEASGAVSPAIVGGGAPTTKGKRVGPHELMKESQAKDRFDPMQKDARRYPRVPTRGECFAELGGGWEGSVLDLSLGGMLLRVKRELTPSSSYFVKLMLGNQVLVAEARVVRVASQEGESRAGMEFRRLTTSDMGKLKQFIDGALAV